ncbi:MAG: c-type cytochrome [Planctomycetes bacterium]|nr:c-type cytochrome [Planctomycetota bacterium]
MPRPHPGIVAKLSIRIAVVLAFVSLVNCEGPQQLSVAIIPADEHAYVQHLNDDNGDARTAFLNWMATERKQDFATLENQDSSLSTTRNPFDAYKDREAVSRGAVIYKYHCARCHGDDARGNGPSVLEGHSARDFHSFGNRFASTLHRGAPRKWFRVITEGDGETLNYPDDPSTAMPPFKDKLTREQTWLVITYMQSLDKHAVRKTTPSSDTPNTEKGADGTGQK